MQSKPIKQDNRVRNNVELFLKTENQKHFPHK